MNDVRRARSAPEPSSAKYVVITPARNEEHRIGTTVVSMLAQTLPPAQWIIVDDGSTDDTVAVIEDLAVDVSWLKVVQAADRGERVAGTGVMQAFSAGYAQLDVDDWDFVVKLDADLEFAPAYFERCLAEFASEAALGIAGGKVYDADGESITYDSHPRFHVRGATKIYRRACWDQIGGLTGGPGWDTLDEVKANRAGWKTRTLLDVPIFQLRPTGQAAGTWANWKKNGDAAYRSGYLPAFLLARAARRLVQPPSVVAPTGLVWGYLRAWSSRTDRIDDELLRYVRREQWNRLTGRPTIWR